VPVDVIWAIDTSGSMSEEIAQVKSLLGTAFATRALEAEVDLRLIMIAARGTGTFQVCVAPPLGGPSCTDESPLFFSVSQTVASTNALSLLLSTYDSPNPVLNWSGLLRPGALREFVVVTDDNAALSATVFDLQLLNKLPAGTFGTAANRNYVFNGIIGVTAGNPAVRCPTAVNTGAQYQTLSNLTGGVVLPVCDADYTSNFRQLADAIASDVACQLSATTATAAQLIDAGTPELRLRGDGGTVLQRVPDSTQCSADGWYYDDNLSPKVMRLCPAACGTARDAGAVELIGRCPSPPPPALPAASWAVRAGDAAPQLLHAVAGDGDGGAVVAGELRGAADLGGGALTSAGLGDVVVARFSSSGSHLWSRRFGDASSQAAQAVAVDGAGNTVIAGWFQGSVAFGATNLVTAGGSDIFVARLDPAGTPQWAVRFGSATDEQLALSAATDPSGNVFVAGSFNGTMVIGAATLASAGGSDLFVAKLSSAGTVVWARRFGDVAVRQRVRGLAADASGNVVLVGDFDGSLDFGGGALTSAGQQDVFVAKLDPAGVHLWSSRFGDAASQLARAVAVDAAGDVLLVGELAGSADFGGGPRASRGGFDAYAVKLSGAGAHLASAVFGADGDDAALGVAVAGSLVTVVGHQAGPDASSPGAGGRDVFVARLSLTDLGVTSLRRYGDAAFHQSARAVAVDTAGNAWVVGHFTGTLDFGAGPITSGGDADLFVTRLPP